MLTDQLNLVTPRPVPSQTVIGFGLAVKTGIGVGVGVGVPQPLVVRETVVEPRTAPVVAFIR